MVENVYEAENIRLDILKMAQEIQDRRYSAKVAKALSILDYYLRQNDIKSAEAVVIPEAPTASDVIITAIELKKFANGEYPVVQNNPPNSL